MGRFCFVACAVVVLVSSAIGGVCFAAPYAYIPNTGDSTLSVVTNATGDLDGSVDGLGNGPSGVAVGYEGEYVFVTNAADNTLSVVRVDYITDADEDAVIDTINVGVNPLGVAAAPDGDYVYVSNYDDGTVSVIYNDDGSFYLASTKVLGDDDDGDVFNPLGIAVTPDGDVYVADNNGSRVMMFNTSTSTEITVGDNPYGLAISGDGNNVYAANFGSDTLSVIMTDDYDDNDGDNDNQVVATLDVGDGPCGVAVAGGGEYICVANSLDSSLSIITVDGDADDPELAVEMTVELDAAPLGVAAPLNGDYAYVTYASADKVSRVDIADGTVTDLDADNFDAPFAFGRFIGGTPPEEAPDDLSASAESDSTIELTWENNAYDVLGFKIERRTSDDEDTEYEQIDMVLEEDVYDADEGEFVYTDTGLSDDTTYYYRVRAYNKAADSDYSTAASATTDEEESDIACFIGSAGNPGPRSGMLFFGVLAVVCWGGAAGWFLLSRKRSLPNAGRGQ